MPVILGVHDSPFDSGSTLLREGKVVAAVQEERVARVKHCGGFPLDAIRSILEFTGTKPVEIDHVAIGFKDHIFPLQVIQHLQVRGSSLNPLESGVHRLALRAFESYESSARRGYHEKMDRGLSDLFVGHMLRKIGIDCEFERVDHHLAHAASAFYSSGFEECLIVTADARGDGASGTINVGDRDGIHRVSTSPVSGSLGHLYGGVTELLGFGYGSGEGKTMSLAAYGKPTDAVGIIGSFVEVKGLQVKGRLSPHHRLTSCILKGFLDDRRGEDIAYAAQKTIESTVTRLISNAISELNIHNVALAGGIFLNVKLNQRISDLPGVRDVFVHPAAGDSGVSTGCAMVIQAERYGLKPVRWDNVFLGSEYSNDEIRRQLDRAGLSYEYVEDIGGFIGEEILPSGDLVGWFQSRMEYGPRALGARSVLADPREEESPSRIREAIKNRPQFQPFCPSILKSAEDLYVENPKGLNSSFMTMSFKAKSRMLEEAPSVVFIDSTTRVQSVNSQNSHFRELIEAFGRETGVPIVLNTSFNRSGEPIVCSPGNAIEDFVNCGLDWLAIGNYLVGREN